MNIPFSFTTMYAFKLALTFDDKRSISVSSLCQYNELAINSILKQYNNKYETNESADLIDYKEEIINLLQEYSNIFHLSGNKLCVYEKISEKDISNLLKEVDIEIADIFTFIYKFSSSIEVFNLLGITNLINFSEKCKNWAHSIERKVEEAYLKTPHHSSIKKLLSQRTMLKLLIYTHSKKYIDNYWSIPSNDGVPIDENFDYLKESEYIKHGDPYPIDNELYKNSEFYEDILEEINPIQQCIEDVYQYAIFGSDTLYKDKFDLDMNKLYTQENFSSNEEDYTELEIAHFDKSYQLNFDIEDEEFAFYITYIQKCEELISSGHTQLEFVKNRLLYLLDDSNLCLYNPDNFEKAYNQAINYETDEESFEFFENEAKYFIEDIFEGNAGKKIEKIIFVSTYYIFTKNQEIIDILSNYQNHPNFEFVSNIILDSESKRNNL